MKTFEVVYQAAGAGTGKSVNMKVFKPDHTEDGTQEVALTEIGTTGRYYGTFNADAPDWSCQVDDDSGGKSVKHFGKDKWDSHGVADLVADVQTAITVVATSISTLQGVVDTMDGKVDGVDSAVTGLVTSVGGLVTQLTSVELKIDNLEAPPMIG